MRHLSLCAGIGGIDLGLHRCIKGLRTVAMVEREAFCVTHLVTKMQAGELDAAPIYPDLHRFPWSKYRGCVDLVSGGFPCQPFSSSGLRKATKDPRHLWPVIKSGLAVLRPWACFFENVDGIVNAPSPGYHSVLHNVVCDLERLGFRSTAGCFTASEVGAPHKRKRWFILGVCDSDQHSKSDKPFNDEASLLPSHSELADSDNKGSRRTIPVASESKHDATSHPSELAHTDNIRQQERCIGSGPQEGNPTTQNAGSSQLADTNSVRRGQSVELPELCTNEFGQPPYAGGIATKDEELNEEYRWPSGPSQAQFGWEARRTVKRSVGGSTDGLPGELEQCPNRRDRLRALGNAVVPGTAARAFATLWYELNPERN